MYSAMKIPTNDVLLS